MNVVLPKSTLYVTGAMAVSAAVYVITLGLLTYSRPWLAAGFLSAMLALALIWAIVTDEETQEHL